MADKISGVNFRALTKKSAVATTDAYAQSLIVDVRDCQAIRVVVRETGNTNGLTFKVESTIDTDAALDSIPSNLIVEQADIPVAAGAQSSPVEFSSPALYVVISVKSTSAGNAAVAEIEVLAAPGIAGVTIQGLVADNDRVAGKPIPIGGRFDLTPRDLDDGDRGEIALNEDSTVLVSSKQSVTLLSAAARKSNGQGAAVAGLRGYTSATIMLSVTADEQTASDTLDVMIQRLLPDGETWDTIARFSQHLGNDGADKYVLDIVAAAGGGARAVDDSTTSPDLAAANTIDVPWGDSLRVAWIINDDSGNANFVFFVAAHFRL